jgi:hypothetical protein
VPCPQPPTGKVEGSLSITNATEHLPHRMLGQLAVGSIGAMLQRRAAIQTVQCSAVVAMVGDTTAIMQP